MSFLPNASHQSLPAAHRRHRTSTVGCLLAASVVNSPRAAHHRRAGTDHHQSGTFRSVEDTFDSLSGSSGRGHGRRRVLPVRDCLREVPAQKQRSSEDDDKRECERMTPRIDRELTAEERVLVEWLLDHGTSDSSRYRSQLERARVTTQCCCGCASIDFAIDGIVPKQGEPISVLSDYEWIDSDGRLFGVFAFARSGLLAGLEVWSQDGLATADYLPELADLRPIGTTSIGAPGTAPE